MHFRNKKHVLVLAAQVPFVRGGAEFHCEGLVDHINQRASNVVAELVNIPFKWYPETQLINDILAWRLLDLTEANGTPIDLVIGTKFPSYAAMHPNKVIWLIHQHRVLYDLQGTQFDAHRNDIARNAVRDIDTALIREAKTVRTNGFTTADRLRRYNGIEAEPLYPPSKYCDLIRPGEYGDYILCVGRLDKLKRPDLLVRAVAAGGQNLKVRFAGSGPLRSELEALVKSLRIQDRCQILGFVPDAELLSTLSNARAVFYGPIDEEYGYSAVEAFQAEKPVITCSDSGEVASLVGKTGAGWVVPPSPEAIAACLDRVMSMESAELRRLGSGGADLVRSVSWSGVYAALIEPFL